MKTPLSTAGRQTGFTLLELMVTVAVATILLAIAVPSFQDVIRRNRLAAATNDFLASIYYTRSEAVKEDKRAIMCASSNGSTCTGSWADGWIVVVDSNRNDEVDETDKLVLVREALSSDVFNITDNLPVASRIAYIPSGRVRGRGNGRGNGTITIAVSGYDAKKEITISNSGRPRVKDG
ncbi:GspH/FimT family pseudopilin [Allochromatium vinosum]|uniref:GspH/FimT family pseudopilin n=1 Tax=Allochromatium vinosum TaxID=1049 RepID=UPI00190663B3|nr:GspH/FimT family pseudopilin [Allochromatium vinosum]MBK1654356.1 hypothetical protein [Allochromatium vinosum]